MAQSKNKAKSSISLVGAMQMLADKFPFDLEGLLKGKTYTSIWDYLIDLLYEFGVTPQMILSKLIAAMFGEENIFNEKGQLTVDGDKLTVESSEFFMKLEDVIKAVLGDIITALVNCSVDPFLPKDRMDKSGYSGSEPLENRYGHISIPVSLIDSSGMLQVSPLNKMGKYYYNVDSESTVNTLYKTKDMNAFLWYVLNRGTSSPITEKNKCVWDSRRTGENRTTNNKWQDWIRSKSDETSHFNSGNGLFPILQIERDDFYTEEQRLKVSLARETYVKWKKSDEGEYKERRSLMLYRFINDYLKSITILQPKTILANFLQELAGSQPQLLTVGQGIVDAKIGNIIKKAIDDETLTEDTVVDDCFFSFSNDNLNNFLEENLKKRYLASNGGTESYDGKVSDTIDNLFNDLSNSASLERNIDTITKTAFDIQASAATAGGTYTTWTGVNSWESIGDYFKDMLMKLLKSIVKSIMTPQVMLLFAITYDMLGLLNVKDLSQFDINAISDAIQKKIISMIYSLIQEVIQMVVDLLMDLVFKYLKPLIVKISGIMLSEELILWYRLLEQVLELLPKFKLYQKDIIDDVNYADIVNEITTPQSNSNC